VSAAQRGAATSGVRRTRRCPDARLDLTRRRPECDQGSRPAGDSCAGSSRVAGASLTKPAAVSTVGTFLRAFTVGHVRQLDAVQEDLHGAAWPARRRRWTPRPRHRRRRCGRPAATDRAAGFDPSRPPSARVTSPAFSRRASVFAAVGRLIPAASARLTAVEPGWTTRAAASGPVVPSSPQNQCQSLSEERRQRVRLASPVPTIAHSHRWWQQAGPAVHLRRAVDGLPRGWFQRKSLAMGREIRKVPPDWQNPWRADAVSRHGVDHSFGTGPQPVSRPGKQTVTNVASGLTT